MIMVLAVLALAQPGIGQDAPPPVESAPPRAKEGLPLSVSYQDGLWFKSDDGRFQAVVNGRVTPQYRAIFDRPNDVPPSAGASRTQPNGLQLRHARFDLSGLYQKQWEFRLQLDFPSGTQSNTGTAPSSVTGTIQDAYLGWKPSPDFLVRIGQMKEPFGLEQMTSARAIDFAERSILDRLVPGRDLGIYIAGKPFSGLLEYELAAFNGAGRAVVDNNDEKDVAARLRVLPFKSQADGFLLQGLRLGVAGTFGDVDTAAANPVDPLDLTSMELNIKFLDAGGAGNSVDGRRTRMGLEFSLPWESVGLRAEWIRRTDGVLTPAGRGRISVIAWNASVTAILTGEKKVHEERVMPLHPVHEGGGWGAVELAARIAMLRVDDDVFSRGLSSAAANANAVRVVTAGVNWYLTRNLRISADLILERYNRDIGFANGRQEHTFKGTVMRFQFDF